MRYLLPVLLCFSAIGCARGADDVGPFQTGDGGYALTAEEGGVDEDGGAAGAAGAAGEDDGGPLGMGGASSWPDAGGADADPGACGNGAVDGTETDTDCGGSDCAPCPSGASCKTNVDCESTFCSGVGPSQPGTCT